MRGSAILSFALRAAGAAMTYVFVFVMARVMSIEDFGLLGTVIAASLFLSMIGSLGQYTAMVRFIPPLLARDQRDAASAIVRHGARLAFFGNAALALLLLAGVGVANWQGWIGNPVAYAVAILILAVSALFDFQAYLLRSYRMVALAIAPKDIGWRGLTLLVVGGILLAREARFISIEQTFAVMLASGIALIGATWLLATWRHGLPSVRQVMDGQADEDTMQAWRSARVPLWMNAISALAFSNIDILIVSAMIGPEAAGLYFAANRIAMAPNFFLQSYVIVVGPMLSQRHGVGDAQGAADLARKASLEIFLPTLAVCLVLGIFGQLVLGAFGPAFTAALPILWILLAAALAQTVFGIADVALNMCGGEREAMKIGIETVIGGTFLLLLCTAAWGATGIATGVLITVIWRRFRYWRAAESILGMRVDVISALRGLRRG